MTNKRTMDPCSLGLCKHPLLAKCIAEIVGTFILVFIGTGSVAAAVTTGTYSGIWQVSAVWAFGVALAIHAVAAVSGAHLNPSVTFALFLLRKDADLGAKEVLTYMFSQLVGAILAACFVLAVWGEAIVSFEDQEGLLRGDHGSELSAMMFGCYFPNPATALDDQVVTAGRALFVEAFATGVLMFMVLALTDDRNEARPPPGMVPFFIGFTVAVLVSLFGALTQTSINPARDFGPRIVAALAGWGKVAIPGPRNGFWIYIVGPFIGAPIGGLLYDLSIRTRLPEEEDAAEKQAIVEGQEMPKNEHSTRDHPPLGLWVHRQSVLQAVIREAIVEANTNRSSIVVENFSKNENHGKRGDASLRPAMKPMDSQMDVNV